MTIRENNANSTALAEVADKVLRRLESEGIDVTDDQACWPWPGNKNSRGYGRISSNLTPEGYVHRILYLAFIGPIESGNELDHACHSGSLECRAGDDCTHRACCNFSHVQSVPVAVNRGLIRGPKQYMCETGEHQYDPETAYRGRCRGCYNEACRLRNAAARMRKAEARVAAGLPPARPGPVPRNRAA